MIELTPELIKPDYSIYDYSSGIYKVVRFKGDHGSVIPYSQREKKGNTDKLAASLSRARRVVLELALCNDWEYFCTFTIAKDRKNLEKFKKQFTQFIRDCRKKYGVAIDYVLVPEVHKDGSWHMHGLFRGIRSLLVSFRDLWLAGEDVPLKLVDGGFYNWKDYQNKFGFCSFAPIKNNIAVGFYVTKYISKQLSDSCLAVGMHLYYCSAGLNRAVKHGDIYGACDYLNNFLQNHYEFCDTGMTHARDGCSWDFALEYMLLDSFDDLQAITQVEMEVNSFYEVCQTALDGF